MWKHEEYYCRLYRCGKLGLYLTAAPVACDGAVVVTALEIEIPEEDGLSTEAIVGRVLESHAHKFVGKDPSLGGALALGEQYARVWAMGLGAGAELCECVDIPERAVGLGAVLAQLARVEAELGPALEALRRCPDAGPLAELGPFLEGTRNLLAAVLELNQVPGVEAPRRARPRKRGRVHVLS